MVTFVESPLFTKQVHDYLTDDEYRAFQLFLAANLDVGVVDAVPVVFGRFAGTAVGPARVAASEFYILSEQKPEKFGCL